MGLLRSKLSVTGICERTCLTIFPKKYPQSYLDDNILLKIPPGQQAEGYIVKVGTAAINANVIISQAKTREEADN